MQGSTNLTLPSHLKSSKFGDCGVEPRQPIQSAPRPHGVGPEEGRS